MERACRRKKQYVIGSIEMITICMVVVNFGNSAKTAMVLIMSHIIYKFGVPGNITTDQGTDCKNGGRMRKKSRRTRKNEEE